VNTLLIGLLGALVATNRVAAASNLVEQTTGVAISAIDTNNPVEKEFKQLEADDDAAHEEVDRWIRENNEFAAKGAGIPDAELNARILKRLDLIRKRYEDFIKRHPRHAKARVAFASFLNDMGDEEEEMIHLEKARELDPKDPAVWNNLANYYGHNSPVKKAFEYYEKAIALDPNEPIYYHNFGTTVYLFRKDVKEHYNINEQQVFDKALDLYRKAMALDPTNFSLASDVAQTYYGIRPLRTNNALQAWTNALSIATDEIEREGVYIHLARIKIMTGSFQEAHAHLKAVTNSTYNELKRRLIRNLNERETGTNSPPASAATNTEPAQNAESSSPASSSGKFSLDRNWRY
jgi:tetratricopeptide (TPR) repeat protein